MMEIKRIEVAGRHSRNCLQQSVYNAECVCHVGLEARAHEQATERLRDAAPVLLEALKNAEHRLAEVSNYLGPFDHAAMFRSLTITIHECRTAIAEAMPVGK